MIREYIIKISDEVMEEDGDLIGTVPQLIRCKDCRYWQDNNGGYPNPDCPWGTEETPDPDDYCSFGEPKDGDDG